MAGPPYLLDTNILLSLVRQNDLGQYLGAIYWLVPPTADHQVSIVSVGELLSIAAQRGWGHAKHAALTDLVAMLTVHAIDNRFTEAYAEIDAASHAVGHKMGKNDLWLAATARVLGLTLLTTDKDFDHLHPAWVAIEWVDPSSKLTPRSGYTGCAGVRDWVTAEKPVRPRSRSLQHEFGERRRFSRRGAQE